MHILQIKKQTETWIVAISQHTEDITDYLATLSVELQADAVSYEIPIEFYPFILIENTLTSHDSNAYFEFCDFETIQQRIEAAREQQVKSEDHIYFKYYYISEPYGQTVTDENWMQYLRHTPVTNYVLAQPYPISYFHEEVKKNVSNYDLDRLDQLFEHTKTRFTSTLEKEDLAINGYESLFWDMNYDHACGKLTEDGITYLLPMVDTMEILLGEKKWRHRSFALHILLKEACDKKSENAHNLLKDTVESFEQYVLSEPEEKLEIHRLLALAYRWMMQVDADTAFSFWQHAVLEIEKAITFDPKKASWALLFELIYAPYPEDQKITDAQVEAQKHFNTKAQELETTFGAEISYPIALAYQHLKEHLEWKNAEHAFPEKTALRWTEKAIAYNPKEITRIDLHECAQFFYETGVRTKRIDFLVKTISLYERVLKTRTDNELEVYYIANLWKEIAAIHTKNKERALADESIMQAIAIYNKYPSSTSTNFRYAEFLEYCYAYEGNITKPTVADLKRIGEEIEIQAEGYHSYPYLLLMRVALLEQNQSEAILQLTKSLILHELCADSTFNALVVEVEHTDFNQVKYFLNETKLFMKEVEGNYFYDPKIKWKKLRIMPNEEIFFYWEKRKEEIRNRPPHTIE